MTRKQYIGDMEEKKRIRLGIDIGSTTAKVMAIHESDEILYAKYVRHNARVKEALLACLTELEQLVDDPVVSVRMTGSVGMGVAEKYAIPSCRRWWQPHGPSVRLIPGCSL